MLYYVTYPHNFVAFHTGHLHIVLQDILVLLWVKNRVGDDTQGTGYSFEEIDRQKSVINWFKIYSPSSSQLLSPQ